MRRLLFSLVLAAACGGSHQHGPAAHPDDARRLYVEVATGASHRGALRDGAAAGLAAVSFAVPVDGGGDVELQLEVAKLDDAGGRTRCNLKIFVFRLPQHDLLGIADGAAHATGDDAETACIRGLGATLVRGKVRGLLRRQLDAKR